MTWVVKDWRTDGLERLLADEARASVRAAREDAERDARRARRAADRTTADAAAQLEALERIGVELRETIRRARAARPPAPASPAATPPAPAAVPADRPRRAGRASMRSSPLGELFRATAAG
jgi:hypothetical protein